MRYVALLTAFVCGPGMVLTAEPTFRPRANDWPQWRGQNRDGRSSETGLLQEWPKDGPPLAWKAQRLGGGYASVAVAAGRVFTLGRRGSDLVVVALDERNGKEYWAQKVGGPWSGEGPNSTPAIDGNRLYVILPPGDVVCLEVAAGKEVWRRDLKRDFGARFPGRGSSESPLVDGQKVIGTPGGVKATLVALDKNTGKTLWTAVTPQHDQAAYSSPVVLNAAGERQYIQLVHGGLVGVSARDGKFLWRYDNPANELANCSTPLALDDHVFAASAYNRGGGLARIVARSGGMDAEEVFFSRKMKNHHGGMVAVDGYLYGADGGNNDRPALVCLDLKTGQVMWSERRAGKGALAYADGRLYYRNEDGRVRLVEATPRAYVEHGAFMQPDRSDQPAWSNPAIANGRLYLRDQDALYCYDVKQRGATGTK